MLSVWERTGVKEDGDWEKEGLLDWDEGNKAWSQYRYGIP